VVDLGDVVTLINYLFRDGAPPVEAVKRGIGFDSNIKIELPPQIRETKEGYVSKITFPGVYSFQKAKIDVRLGFRNPGRHTIVFFPDLSAEFKTLRGGITGSIASITPMDYRKTVVFNPVPSKNPVLLVNLILSSAINFGKLE